MTKVYKTTGAGRLVLKPTMTRLVKDVHGEFVSVTDSGKIVEFDNTQTYTTSNKEEQELIENCQEFVLGKITVVAESVEEVQKPKLYGADIKYTHGVASTKG